MQARADGHVQRMAGITEKVLPVLENMQGGEILDRARDLERYDFVARRNYKLDTQPVAGGPVNFNFLCNQSAIQIKSPESQG